MSVHKYIYGEFATDSLITAITNNAATLPLIRELNFHYELKVLEHKLEYQRVGAQSQQTTFYLANKHGFAQGHVYTWEEDGKTHYAYNTPFVSKERGKDDLHRHTWTSHKLPSLMGALKKSQAIPDDTVDKKMRRIIDGLKHQVEGHFGKTYKSTDSFDGEEFHNLLKALLLGDHSGVDRSKCQAALDKYNEIDSNVIVRKKEVTRLFESPFYLIAADKRGHCMVGKVKRVKDGNGVWQNSIVQDFHRITQETLYKVYPDLVPILTMTKVAYEDGKHQMITPFMPRTDSYDSNLDIAYYYPSSITEYGEQWMMIPCL
jgi:hypothetical protein